MHFFSLFHRVSCRKNTMSAIGPSKIEVRKLSLTQLHRLTVRGSRRARAELEHRMAAADTHDRSVPRSDAEVSSSRVAHRLVAPTSKLMRVVSLNAASSARSMTFPGNHETPPSPQDAQILRLQALAQQDEARQRAQGPPGLMGMALMVWSALLLFGGLVLLTHKGSLYYILFGLACAVIGWLLLRCKRIAIWGHVACAVVALLWAWRGYAGSTFVTALIQSAPIWVSALWIALPSVREPLN